MTCKPERYLFNEPFGMFYVFNNVEFDNHKLPKRDGSDLDANSLNDVVNKYNFITQQPFENFTAGMFFQKLDDIRKEDYSKISCLAIAFLSHGSEGQIEMKDYGVNVDDIVQSLSEIKGLQGKPKILIFQACRGTAIATAGIVQTSDCSDQLEADGPVSESGNEGEYADVGVTLLSGLPIGADFIMCNSTTKNHVSFRNPIKGSRYIRKFCNVLRRYVDEPEELDFLQLLTKISMEVAMTNQMDKRRQISSFTSTLTKSLYLPRKQAITPTQ